MADYINSIKVNNQEYEIGGDNFDGQWVAKTTDIFAPGTIAQEKSLTIDISSYLPDNKYNYEVLFDCYMNTSTTKNNFVSLFVCEGSSASGSIGARLGRVVTRTTTNESTGCNCILPIKKDDQYIILQNEGTAGTSGQTCLRARGYRRIGTNT